MTTALEHVARLHVTASAGGVVSLDNAEGYRGGAN